MYGKFNHGNNVNILEYNILQLRIIKVEYGSGVANGNKKKKVICYYLDTIINDEL